MQKTFLTISPQRTYSQAWKIMSFLLDQFLSILIPQAQPSFKMKLWWYFPGSYISQMVFHCLLFPLFLFIAFLLTLSTFCILSLSMFLRTAIILSWTSELWLGKESSKMPTVLLLCNSAVCQKLHAGWDFFFFFLQTNLLLFIYASGR